MRGSEGNFTLFRLWIPCPIQRHFYFLFNSSIHFSFISVHFSLLEQPAAHQRSLLASSHRPMRIGRITWPAATCDRRSRLRTWKLDSGWWCDDLCATALVIGGLDLGTLGSGRRGNLGSSCPLRLTDELSNQFG